MQNRQERALVSAQQQQVGEKYLDRADFVIIGNGIAGLTAAVEARRLAPQKRIVMITDQLYPTINTPALKQFAIGKLDREQLLAYPSGTERRERIHVVTARVEDIHPSSKYITLRGKGGFGYDKLLIANGSSPAGLPQKTPGRDFDGVMTLHKLEDYLSLRRRLAEVRDAVVIGGGVHAIETVMGLLYYGIQVHWLIRGTTFMAKMLDSVSSGMVLESIRHSGAHIYTETEVAGVVARVGCVAGVITNRQEMIPCQLVLTCTGTSPALGLAKSCKQPLTIQNGIQVDDQLNTNIPDILAAGDVASLKNPQTGKYEPRAQWYAAVDQGRIAGATLAGDTETAQQPFGVLWHATHLGELSMLSVGEPLKEESRIITLTDNNAKGYRRLSILDDRLIGYLSVGKTPPDSLAIKRIVDEGHSVRNITRDLLKGDFDARKYLSQIHSKAAQGIVTRQLPPLAEAMVQRLPNTNEPLRISPSGRPGSGPLRISPSGSSRQEASDPRMPAAQQEQPMYRDRDEQPVSRDREGGRQEQPMYRDRDERPVSRDREGSRQEQPMYRDRDEQPMYRDRDERPASRDREGSRQEQPMYRDRDERPTSREREGGRQEQPMYRDRDERLVSRDREGGRQEQYRDRDERPTSRGREGGRQEQPMYRDRDERLTSRDREGSRQEQPMYRDRDERPTSREREAEPSQGRKMPFFEEEPIDAFTGRLPAFSQADNPGERVAGRKRTEPLESKREAAPFFEEEAIDAFTGKLPNIQGVASTREVKRGNPNFLQEADPTLMPVDDTGWNTGQLRNIWSYADKEEPARKRAQPSQPERESTVRKHTGGLWAYGNQDKS